MTNDPSVSNEDIFDAIRDTERDGLLADRQADGLSGLSGKRTVGLLQRLTRVFRETEDACYLEVGVFRGLTLVSAALEAGDMPCFGIDNFATLDPDGVNRGIVEDRIEKFRAVNAKLINSDFEQALERLGDYIGERRVCVYLIDGPHDYRSQLICLTLIQPFLHENAVIVIDDANYPDVRWSTRDFLLGFPEFRLAFDAYSPDHPANLTGSDKTDAENRWLNGIHVLVRDSEGTLDRMLPPVDEFERKIYLNEWLAHRLRLADLAPEALSLADAILRGDEEGEMSLRERLTTAYMSRKPVYDGLHGDRNVYSKDLPSVRFNAGLLT